MSGLLNCGGGENVPGIHSACVTRNFAYLLRSPWYLPCEIYKLVLQRWEVGTTCEILSFDTCLYVSSLNSIGKSWRIFYIKSSGACILHITWSRPRLVTHTSHIYGVELPAPLISPLYKMESAPWPTIYHVTHGMFLNILLVQHTPWRMARIKYKVYV